MYQKQKWFEAAKVFDNLIRQLQELDRRPMKPERKDTVSPPPSLLAEAYYHRGLAYQRMNSLTEALADFTKTLQLNPDDADASFHRASARHRLWVWGEASNIQEVLTDLSRAIRLNPDYTEAYFSRGMLYVQRKSYELARADFIKASELDPTEPAAFHNIGITYALEKRFKEAENQLKSVLKLFPQYHISRETLKLVRISLRARRPEPRRAKDRPPGLVRAKQRIRELETEIRLLKEFQKQLLEKLSGPRLEPTAPFIRGGEFPLGFWPSPLVEKLPIVPTVSPRQTRIIPSENNY